MKTLYLECNMGAAGDMLMAALLELLPDRESFLEQLNQIGLPGVTVTLEKSVKCGLAGSHIVVRVGDTEESSSDVSLQHDHDHERHNDHDHHHEFNHKHHHENHHDHNHEHTHEQDKLTHEHNHHGSLTSINAVIEQLEVSDQVKQQAQAIYHLIAAAESEVHQVPIELVHLHEVGALDAITDIVGVCLLIEAIAPDQVLASPVHVGSGHVRCAHGILPVPAPATANILRDVPIYGGTIQGELCTPTGAALLKFFAMRFDSLPVMRVAQIGYGMGKKDFAVANCVRAFLGYTSEQGDEVAELSCNLDDMTPEALAFAQEQFFAAGALDVYTTPIGMKKSRPGILLTCMCRRDATDQFAALMLQHTTTLGVRESISRRYTLQREEIIRQTAFGPVRFKKATGHEVVKMKPEYEDIARIARENKLSFAAVMESLAPINT
ncbi:MAG: nickel pincer cofactor biosynthesis protein LarC [Bacillota bacterium]|nr:nickel pincer cofactor biosynthesis protein LarC [Bacillota bacterium]